MRAPFHRLNVHARAGFTLIELAVAIAILGLVMGSIMGVMESAKKGYGQGSTATLVQTLSRRALDRIASELENAGQGTLLPNPLNIACDDLVFQSVIGVDEVAGTPIFGNSTRLRFAYGGGDTNNGLDDDGDGLIDEGRVILTRNYLAANESSVVIARGVNELAEGELANGLDDNGNGLADERGFSMTLQGNLLILRLTVSRVSAEGTTTVSTNETAVSFRN